MNYSVREGKERVFEDAFRNVLSVMRQLPGHRESHLYRDVDSPRDYLIVSEWEDRASFDSFVGSDRFARVVSWGRDEVLSGRPRHEIYER